MGPIWTGNAALDPRLAPTKRLLLSQIGHRNGGVCNRRAERLVLRAMTRDWDDTALEQLLGELLRRAEAPEIASRFTHRRAGSRVHSLARANGWGSAGQCPAVHVAKTPAAWEQVSRVATAIGASSCGTTPTAVAGEVRA